MGNRQKIMLLRPSLSSIPFHNLEWLIYWQEANDRGLLGTGNFGKVAAYGKSLLLYQRRMKQ